MYLNFEYHLISTTLCIIFTIIIINTVYLSKGLEQLQNHIFVISIDEKIFSSLLKYSYAELSSLSPSIYKNSTLNLEVVYPQNLTWKESKDQVTFFFPIKNFTDNTSIENLTIKTEPVGNTPLTTLASLKTIEYNEDLIDNDFEILDSGYFKIPITVVHKEGEQPDIKNYESYKIMFSKKVDDKPYRVLHYLTVIDGKEYSFIYTSNKNDYNIFKKSVVDILDGITIQSEIAGPSSQIKNIPQFKVGKDPYDIVSNPNTNKSYITNYRFGSVTVIDDLTDQIIGEIEVEKFPSSISVNTGFNLIYVANSRSNSISVIDGSKDSKETIKDIPVGNRPVTVEIDELEKGVDSMVFVANSLSNSISVIDSAKNQIIENGNISGFLSEPVSISINPIINRLYIVNKNFDEDNGWVSVVDYFITKDKKFKFEQIKNITVEKSPFSSDINLFTNKIYVTNSYSNSLSVIDGSTNKVTQTIEVGTYPTSIAIDKKNSLVYITNYLDNTISLINSTFPGYKDKFIKEIQTERFPSTVYFNPVSKLVYVINQGPKSISILNNTEFISGITYHVTPKKSGVLECNNINIKDTRYLRHNINSNITCFIILPKEEYKYDLVSENLKLNTLKDKFEFTPSDYGNITTLVTIPQEIILPKGFWSELYVILLSVVLAPFAGWFIPYLGQLVIKYRQKKLMKMMMLRIIQMIEQSTNKKIEDNIGEFTQIRNEITNLLINGKITEGQFNILNQKISDYLNKLET